MYKKLIVITIVVILLLLCAIPAWHVAPTMAANAPQATATEGGPRDYYYYFAFAAGTGHGDPYP